MERNAMPNRRIQTPVNGQRSTVGGFTLIELLTVIVIIAILTGILLPVVSKIRKSAHVASTQATIATLVAGIEAYHQTFGAYPAQLVGTTGINSLPTVAGQQLQNNEPSPSPAFTLSPSSSEWLFLWMMGGVNVTITGTGSPPTVTGFVYSQQYVGSGPVSFNALQNYKHFKPLIGVTLQASKGDIPLSQDSQYAGKGFNDTAVPEFLDDFSPGMPILYLRANAGATEAVYSDGGTNSVPTASATNAQYNFGSASGTYGPQYYYGVKADPPDCPGGWNEYLGDPNSRDKTATGKTQPYYAQPRQKDGYILISAGPDGIYGTKDDVTNFGEPLFGNQN